MKRTLLLLGSLISLGATAQTIASVAPNAGNRGQTLDVTITGNNTHFYSASGTSVNFEFLGASSTNINSVNIIHDGERRVNLTIPSFTADGFYDVTVSNLTDGNVTMTDGFQIGGNIGVNELNGNGSVSVYPNPSLDHLNVIYSSNSNFSALITPINISELQKGNYVVKMKTENGFVSTKFVKL